MADQRPDAEREGTMSNLPKKDLVRPEGVYCKWLSYPEGFEKNNILQIERVNGDCTISKFTCSIDETPVIANFLRGHIRWTGYRHVRNIAVKHWPTSKTVEDSIVKEVGICSCGAAEANGVRPYKEIWADHMAEIFGAAQPVADADAIATSCAEEIERAARASEHLTCPSKEIISGIIAAKLLALAPSTGLRAELETRIDEANNTPHDKDCQEGRWQGTFTSGCTCWKGERLRELNQKLAALAALVKEK